jgi:hypothetical protein
MTNASPLTLKIFPAVVHPYARRYLTAFLISPAVALPSAIAVQMPPPAVVHWPQRQNALSPGSVFLIFVFRTDGVGAKPS